MSTRMKCLGLLLFFVVLIASPLLAQEGEPQGNPRDGMRAAQAAQADNKASLYRAVADRGRRHHHPGRHRGRLLPGQGQSSSACEASAANPGGAPTSGSLLLLGLILIETLVILRSPE